MSNRGGRGRERERERERHKTLVIWFVTYIPLVNEGEGI